MFYCVVFHLVRWLWASIILPISRWTFEQLVEMVVPATNFGDKLSFMPHYLFACQLFLAVLTIFPTTPVESTDCCYFASLHKSYP